MVNACRLLLPTGPRESVVSSEDRITTSRRLYIGSPAPLKQSNSSLKHRVLECKYIGGYPESKSMKECGGNSEQSNKSVMKQDNKNK